VTAHYKPDGVLPNETFRLGARAPAFWPRLWRHEHSWVSRQPSDLNGYAKRSRPERMMSRAAAMIAAAVCGVRLRKCENALARRSGPAVGLGSWTGERMLDHREGSFGLVRVRRAVGGGYRFGPRLISASPLPTRPWSAANQLGTPPSGWWVKLFPADAAAIIVLPVADATCRFQVLNRGRPQ
jgi:hypothetical protein